MRCFYHPARVDSVDGLSPLGFHPRLPALRPSGALSVPEGLKDSSRWQA